MNFEGLSGALTEDAPCGADLDGTLLLASFDSLRIFGRKIPLGDDIDWREVRSKSLEALSQTRDLRPLTFLAASALRLDGIEPFVRCLEIGAGWIQDYWSEVYPRVDDDAILRQNSLAAFADRMAVIDALRRVPLVAHPQLGAYSLRDAEIASGAQPAPEGMSEAPTEAQIAAAFHAANPDAVEVLASTLSRGVSAVTAIESVMREQAGSDAVPSLEPLSGALRRILRLLEQHFGSQGATASAIETARSTPAVAGGTGLMPVGSVGSRHEAVRALDAVAEFFRRNEPSSPVPLIVERAKRMISMDFVQILGEIAPGALPEVRMAAGLRDEE